MEIDFIGAAAAFAAGVLISFCNYKISQHFLKKRPDRLSLVSLIRQPVQILYIVALFFGAKYTPWDRTFLLIGGALGITLPMLIFTSRLLKVSKSESCTEANGKEGEGNG